MNLKNKKSKSEQRNANAVGGNHKKILNERVPRRGKDERFREMVLDKMRGTIGEDIMFAIELRKYPNWSTFKKVESPQEFFEPAVYKNPMPVQISYTIFKRPDIEGRPNFYHLYSTYSFVDELTNIEVFERRMYYVSHMPSRLYIKKQIDLLCSAVSLRYEMERRRLLLRCSRPRKLEFESTARKKMLSARILIAKKEHKSSPIFGHMLIRNERAIYESMKLGLNNLNADCIVRPDKVVNEVETFVKMNIDWTKSRLQMSDFPIYMHFSFRSLINCIDNHQTCPMRNRSEQELFNEFNYISSHFAFSAHFCKVLRDFQFRRLAEDTIIRKCSMKGSLLRVMPSRYRNYPATSVVRISKGGFLISTMSNTTNRAPSIESLSGYSTDSAASTATMTPLDWAQNWKFQDKDFEHRLMKSGYMNPAEVKREAKQFWEERIQREMLRRRTAVRKVNASFVMRQNIPIFDELMHIRQPASDIFLGISELNKIRKVFERFEDAGTMDPATKILLSRRSDCILRSQWRKNWMELDIEVTDGWRTFSQTEPPIEIDNVGRFLRRPCSWVESNCYSFVDTIPRCDQITIKAGRKFKKLTLFLISVTLVVITIVCAVLSTFL